MNAVRGWLLVVAGMGLLSISLVGCGKGTGSSVRLAPLSDDAVILIYAAGVGEEANFLRSTSMDEALSRAMKRRVVSLGQAGELTESALGRLPDVLRDNDPDLMILGYGAVDLWKKTDRAKLKADLIAMIDLAQKNNTQVVMLALPDLNKLLVSPDPIFEEVARAKKIPIESEIIRSVLRDSSSKIYRYMVNDKGLERIADAIRALCVKSGALKE